MDRVLSVAGTYAAANSKKGINEGDLAFLADQVTDPSLSFTSEQEDIVDALNNVVMQLQGAKSATFAASNAFFNTQILAAQTGGKIVNEETTFTKYDIIALDEAKGAKLAATPAASAPAVADFKVFKLASDNSLTTASPIENSEYTYVDGVITVTAGNKGDKVLISYEAKATGEHMIAKADESNELMNVTAEVLLRELCKEELYYAFLIMRGKLSGEAEWTMSRDGQHAFELSILPAYCDPDKRLVEVIIVKGEDLVA